MSMSPDRSTKCLLFAIAAGLWLNAARPFVAPQVVQAQSGLSLSESRQISMLAANVADIAADTASMRKSLATMALMR